MSADLLSCPFCGSSADIQNDFGRVFWPQCSNLECVKTNGLEFDNPTDAAESWNTRAALAQKEAAAPGDLHAAIMALPLPKPYYLGGDEAYGDVIKGFGTQDLHDLRAAAAELARAALAQPVVVDAPQDWISVQDRLPEWASRDDTPCVIEGKAIPPTLFSQTVLVFLDSGSVRTDKLTAIEGGAPWFNLYRKRVTYWMPTPPTSSIDSHEKDVT